MVQMNSTLTFFVTASKMCEFPYPRIHVSAFNATELLVASGFEEAFPVMATWKKTRYTRISDILRLCLARKHGKSYLDTDVHFLQLSTSLLKEAVRGCGPEEQQQECPRDHQRHASLPAAPHQGPQRRAIRHATLLHGARSQLNRRAVALLQSPHWTELQRLCVGRCVGGVCVVVVVCVYLCVYLSI